jgi:hypothetical protein
MTIHERSLLRTFEVSTRASLNRLSVAIGTHHDARFARWWQSGADNSQLVYTDNQLVMLRATAPRTIRLMPRDEFKAQF